MSKLRITKFPPAMMWAFLVLSPFVFWNPATGQDTGVDERPVPDSHQLYRIHGFQILLNKVLLDEKHKQKTDRMLELMDQQFGRVADVVPRKALRHLKTVRIWVNPPYEGVAPTAEYHPSSRWLEDNGRNPAMARSIEVTDSDNFEFEDRRMPWVMLHELSHAYHDQVLGSRNVKIREAFEKAKESGEYEEVDRFDGRRIIQDRAYALSNAAEYFAESTEAFFGQNDFYPFDRWELKAVDPTMHDLLVELWGVGDSIQNRIR